MKAGTPERARFKVGRGVLTGDIIRRYIGKRGQSMVEMENEENGRTYICGADSVEVITGDSVRSIDAEPVQVPPKRRRVPHIPENRVDGKNIHVTDRLSGNECGGLGEVRNTYTRDIGAQTFRDRRCKCLKCGQAFMSREEVTK